ncbi:MAG: CRTAC1 family protein, partial [Chloroflexota bacterium]
VTLAAGRHEPFQILLPQIIPAAVLFFAAFVLTDSETSPRPIYLQILMGGAVAALAIGLQGLGIGLSFAIALLAWNYAFRLLEVAIVAVRGRVNSRVFGSPSPWNKPPVSRRAFLGSVGAGLGALWLGASMRRLTSLDPSMLALAPQTALAGGRDIPQFVDVAAQVGASFLHHGDVREGSPAIGTGVAWGDYDGDGLLDLYVTDHIGVCRLYHNNGDGTFTDLADSAGVSHPGARATSATFVDFDNDGHSDLYVGIAYGPNVLYHNNGDGTFTDVTQKSGLGDGGRTTSTAWADYDGDGFLDVFVANYSDNAVTFDPNTSPIENVRTVRQLPRPQNSLYHNNGDGTFSDVTHLLGGSATTGFGFSAVWFDYNNDGRPDLYVAYDFGNVLQPDTLWRNDGPGGPSGWQFTEVERELGVDSQVNAMGTTSGDYNNDGFLDLAVSNIGPNMLYRNRQGRAFSNVAQSAGVAHAIDDVHNMMNPSMSWGLDFADFNNDGWLDLYVVEGSMYFENVPQPNRLFLNDRSGAFIDVSAASGSDDPGQGRSVAIADYDGDGKLDMVVANYGQPLLLYRNVSPPNGHNWIGLRLEGTRGNRDGVGARVQISAPGLPVQSREVQIGQGLGSCDDTALHFGLGTATHADRIEILWPSGQKQTLRNVQGNRLLPVIEPGTSRWTNG